jgi:SSS family solute:Na+ symporter
MDRMLHRGEYAAIIPLIGGQPEPAPGRNVWLGRLIGFDENFSLGDKWIAGSLFGWSVLWFVVFVVGTIWNLSAPWPVSVWSAYWHITGVGLPILISVVTAIWFTWGGVKDIRSLFRRLREQTVNNLDDGTVVNHQNRDERDLYGGSGLPGGTKEISK